MHHPGSQRQPKVQYGEGAYCTLRRGASVREKDSVIVRAVLSIWIQRDADGNWLAEVQQIPTLRAHAQSHEDAIARVQVLLLRWVAEQIEEGKVKPLEFSVAIRNETQSIGSAFQEAVARFRGAAALSFDRKTQREGAQIAVGLSHEIDTCTNPFAIQPSG